MSYATLSKFNAIPTLLAVGFGCFWMGNSARVIDSDEIVGAGYCTHKWIVNLCPTEAGTNGPGLPDSLCDAQVWNTVNQQLLRSVKNPVAAGAPDCKTHTDAFGAACPAQPSYDATFGCIAIGDGWN